MRGTRKGSTRRRKSAAHHSGRRPECARLGSRLGRSNPQIRPTPHHLPDLRPPRPRLTSLRPRRPHYSLAILKSSPKACKKLAGQPALSHVEGVAAQRRPPVTANKGPTQSIWGRMPLGFARANPQAHQRRSPFGGGFLDRECSCAQVLGCEQKQKKPHNLLAIESVDPGSRSPRPRRPSSAHT